MQTETTIDDDVDGRRRWTMTLADGMGSRQRTRQTRANKDSIAKANKDNIAKENKAKKQG